MASITSSSRVATERPLGNWKWIDRWKRAATALHMAMMRGFLTENRSSSGITDVMPYRSCRMASSCTTFATLR